MGRQHLSAEYSLSVAFPEDMETEPMSLRSMAWLASLPIPSREAGAVTVVGKQVGTAVAASAEALFCISYIAWHLWNSFSRNLDNICHPQYHSDLI